MLSSAEADLARRDAAIPGLATVLDSDAFVAALRRAAPEADLRAAQITYVRYKPRTYCRVAYRLDVAGKEVDAAVGACRPDDLVPWLKEDHRTGMSGPLRPGRIVFAQYAVLVTVFPNDLKLQALPYLADPAERGRLLRELLPHRPELWQGSLRCLRYRPERRFVAELFAGEESQALVKAYTKKGYTRGRHNAQAFQSRGPLRVARLLGGLDNLRLLAFEWLPGRLLFDLCMAAQIDCKHVTATGAALAALHAQEPGGLWHWTREAEAADLVSLCSELGFICPRLARRADELARRLAAQLAAAPAVQRARHGDFSAKQVLVGQPEVAIIDLDWACAGDPAGDLGNFIAQAERFALRGELSASRVDLLSDALLEGYGLATNRPLPERIRLYTAVELFRRTRFPFRSREPDWPQRTEALLDRAETILNTLP